ncbi:MAG: histidinol-phosphate transaminase [Gammaproteobacteria bacterium]|nr:histidinol-phosphate transaminase [Gammaproteobacteria bacterium]
MTVASLARPEIASLSAYAAATQANLTIRLNANEMPSNANSAVDTELNRYPPVRPWKLRERLAEIYSVLAEQVLVTRGSSEAIDLLLRVFCRPAIDNIVISTPTFGMYKVYADIQGAEVRCINTSAGSDFAPDVCALLEACDAATKLVFVCSPNNPTGNSIRSDDLLRLLRNRKGKSLVVVDEAYVEFTSKESTVGLMARHENLVVLRTMSKAYGLAAARVGSVIAEASVIALLDSVMAPYAIATPIIELALSALTGDRLACTAAQIEALRAERRRLETALPDCTDVERVWPSDANFLLVRFRNLAGVTRRLAEHRILIRDFSTDPGLHDCARITIGSTDENDLLLKALTNSDA